MTPQQIEALNIAGQCRATASSPLAKNILVDEGNGLLTELLLDAARIIEALAQPEQEPVAWLLTDKNINSLQVDSIQRLINRLKHAHHTDIRVRINGHDEWFEADWLKHMVRVTPPQPERHELQSKGEHPAPCARYCEANAFKIVIKNLKAQLAQPEQEPVAHCKVRPLRGDESFPKVEIDWVNQPIPGPLFTTPPQRTEQEPLFKKIIDQHQGLAEELKALDEQEPVAWFSPSGNLYKTRFHATANGEQVVTPLYTTPPQRTWVWLTKVERIELLESTHPNNRWSLLALCEAKLKDKNT